MKLVTLNIWGGRVFEPLIKFIKESSRDTDIFLFQEVYDNSADVYRLDVEKMDVYQYLVNFLKNFTSFYCPYMKDMDIRGGVHASIGLAFGTAIFIKKKIQVKDIRNKEIYRKKFDLVNDDWTNIPVCLQHLSFCLNDQKINVYNVHGNWYPGHKLDTKQRLEQSKKIKDYIEAQTGEHILGGDFNLLPETKSVKILEEGLINLIKRWKVKRTRSKLNPYFGTSKFQAFADYIFVSKGIKVLDFKAIDVNVSDHLPLELIFD